MKTYNMRNTFIPASFLAVALSTEKNVLKTDHEILIIREEDASAASRLYRLFFHGEKKMVQPVFADESVSEPDYYSSYE
jgi:hypothetical protein